MRNLWRRRKGNTLVFMALFLPALIVLIAFMIELSRLHFVKNQLQTAADAGALAGAAEMRHFDTSLVSYSFSLQGAGLDKVRPSVQSTVLANSAAHLEPTASAKLIVEANLSNTTEGDIVVGFHNSLGTFSPDLLNANAVRVVTRFAPGHPNNRLPLFFGNILTTDFVNLNAIAVARVERPTLVPFLIYQSQWESLLGGIGTDDFAVNKDTSLVSIGSDGILETIVLPGDWDGLNIPPGNFGWYDLSPDTGTDVICRLLQEGPNSNDMQMFGGQINAGDLVSGVTGIKAGSEAAITGGDVNGITYGSILGKPRIVALYDLCSGQGTSATFRITKFVMARIVAAELGSSPKAVVVQPIIAKDNPNRVQLVK